MMPKTLIAALALASLSQFQPRAELATARDLDAPAPAREGRRGGEQNARRHAERPMATLR